MTKKKCVVCKTNEATVPDRNDEPRYRIRVCADCHAGRLSGDMREITRRRRP